MNTGDQLMVYIDGEAIGCTTAPFPEVTNSDKSILGLKEWTITVSNKPQKIEIEMEYYMRRRNRIYFRALDGTKRKVSADLSEIPQDIKDLKYHTKVIAKMEVVL